MNPHIRLSGDAKYGSIDTEGHYVAPETACDDVVTATVNGVTGTASARVVDADQVQSVELSGGDSLALDQGSKLPVWFYSL